MATKVDWEAVIRRQEAKAKLAWEILKYRGDAGQDPQAGEGKGAIQAAMRTAEALLKDPVLPRVRLSERSPPDPTPSHEEMNLTFKNGLKELGEEAVDEESLKAFQELEEVARKEGWLDG